MGLINRDEKIGKIVTRFPSAAGIFNKFRLDYSFRGDRTLAQAVALAGLDRETVEKELELAIEETRLMNSEEIYWENEPISRIIDHIETRHHTFMVDTMEEITAMLDGPGGKECPQELKALFEKLRDEILVHQRKEEKELFPRLRIYSGNRTKELRETIVAYMTATEDEHDEAGRLFGRINEMTDDFMKTRELSPFMRELYRKLDTLEKDAFLHIHMENSILFKMV